MISVREVSLATWQDKMICRQSARRSKAAPDNVVAGCVLYRIRMLWWARTRLWAPLHNPYGETCSRQNNASFSTGIRQSVGAFHAESLRRPRSIVSKGSLWRIVSIGVSIHSFHPLGWISMFKFAVESLPWWRGITVSQFFREIARHFPRIDRISPP